MPLRPTVPAHPTEVSMHMLGTALAGDLRRDYPMPRHVHDDTVFLVHKGDLDALGPFGSRQGSISRRSTPAA